MATTEDRLRTVLSHAAYNVRPCKICGVRLWFVRDITGMTICFDAVGIDHRGNCAGPKKAEQSEIFPGFAGREAFD